MMYEQLLLFEDPRDELLQQTLQEVMQGAWWQEHPAHRYTDGGGLWWLLHKQSKEIDLEYCREWVRREHPELIRPVAPAEAVKHWLAIPAFAHLKGQKDWLGRQL